jgi:hypothetical protein
LGRSSETNPPEKPSANCPECERLAEVLALASRKYLEAVRAQEASLGSNDFEQIKALENAVVEASQWRELARKALRVHAATHA